MSIQKITTYVALALGVLGLIFQVLILRAGDDAIEMSSLKWNSSNFFLLIEKILSIGWVEFLLTLLPFWLIIYLAIFILTVTVLITVVSSLANLASNGAKLKKAFISVAAFLFVVLISFLFSEGVETPMKDGEVLSAAGSRWVGTGLRTFYILAVGAIGSMIFSGVKRFFK